VTSWPFWRSPGQKHPGKTSSANTAARRVVMTWTASLTAAGVLHRQ